MNWLMLNFPEPIEGISEKTRSIANVSDIYKHTGGNQQAMLAIMNAFDECLRMETYAENKNFISIADKIFYPPYPKGLKIMSGDFGQIVEVS